MKLFSEKGVLLLISFVFLASFNIVADGAGELDSSFTASAFGKDKGSVQVVKAQPDGKILIGGQFTEASGYAASGIARLNADGSADASFLGPDFFSSLGTGTDVRAIVLLADGKILVGGSFLGADSELNTGIRRLNSNGSLDPAFTVTNLSAGAQVNDIEIQTDGKIVVGGTFPGITKTVVRLNADGTLDNTFSGPASTVANTVRDLAIQADGKIVITSDSDTRRLTATGANDDTFTPFVSVQTIAIRPDGKILVGGSFQFVGAHYFGHIALLNADGTPDTTFNQNGIGANERINDIELRPDGKMFIGGFFSMYNETPRSKVALLNADGTLDNSFQTTANGVNLNDIEPLPDGTVLGGTSVTTTSSPMVIRYNANGTIDSAFVPVISKNGRVNRILQQADGKILIAGDFPLVNGVRRNGLARLNTDGSLDTSFLPYFSISGTPVIVYAMALQADGKVLLSTTFAGVVRLNTDGSQDSRFSAIGGVVNDIAVLSNGQILASISNGQNFIFRLNSNGSIDQTFASPQANGMILKIHVPPDGKILIGGGFTQIGATPRGGVARLNADGSLDTTFNPPGGASGGAVQDIDVQPDGKIVLGGSFTALNGNANNVSIGRLNADGTSDASFVQSTNGAVAAVKIQPDGKILIGGTMSAVQGASHNGLARLNSDGSVDSSFNTFANSAVYDINLQADNKILICGQFTKVNKLSAVRVARLLNNLAPPRTPFDFDGDSRADAAVFRPSENKWFILQSSNSAPVEKVFAVAGDVPVPADYDGDGKTDVAIFRPSSGDWWYQSSINGAQINVNFGQSGDIPRPSDFDGDGKTDFIVFRPSNSAWYRLGSTGATSILAFGSAGDLPLIGDFDGDGKSDVSIFRPGTGDWWYASSVSGQFRVVHWGQTGDIPVPADYDGDGATDFAVFRPSNGAWYILYGMATNYTIATFGQSGDKPVPADYDGDGKADLAVFRPSSGTWYLFQTTAGFGAVQWGVSTDVPVENAFLQ